MTPEIQRLLEEQITEHHSANAEYCWWCQMDVNGRTGEAEPHTPECWLVRARQALLAPSPAGQEADNHHNALTCPYCNPKGLVLAEPAGQEEPPANEQWLREIEAQSDETVPYYVPRLISEIRHLERVIALFRKDAKRG